MLINEGDMNNKLVVIGLGYVGLPLAVEFSAHYNVVGFDINEERINELNSGRDRTQELLPAETELLKAIKFTCKCDDIYDGGIYIITVPTPINEGKQPDLSALIAASQTVARCMPRGAYVIFESTVYPGATEEICVPIIEAVSGLKLNEDFYVGYSPERINPGDHTRRLSKICKITSGSNKAAAEEVDSIYRKIITAGTFPVSSIKVAEAAKIIENTQRDVNIGLINELAVLFNKMGIDTSEVLEAAGTKWNFLPFTPGLVGGHCIGVDPYYLTYKAQSIGFNPEIILAGRRVNDRMGEYVAHQLIKQMIVSGIDIIKSKILIMGYTFKANCPDIRNTKVQDVYNQLREYNMKVDIFDPWCESASQIQPDTPIIHQTIPAANYDAILIAVNHEIFKEIDIGVLKNYCRPKHVIYDVKHVYTRKEVPFRL
jgi:UDP-N-acetyl-D-galactosamine dehydrogenase